MRQDLLTLQFDELEVWAPTHPTVVSIELTPEEVEFAFATNGETLRLKLMTAILVAMSVQPGGMSN